MVETVVDKISARQMPERLATGAPLCVWVPDVSDPIGMRKRPLQVSAAYSADVRLNRDPLDTRMTRDRWQLWFEHGDGFAPGLITHADSPFPLATMADVAAWRQPAPEPVAEPEQRPAYVPDPLAVEATEAGRDAGRTHAAWADGGDHPMHVTPEVPERFATVATYYTAAFDDAVTKYEEDSDSV
jgi:hypothetical protein